MHQAPIRPAGPAPPTEVRALIRDVLTTSEAFQALEPETRRDVASSLVRISATAMALADQAQGPAPAPEPPAPRMLATAMNAGQDFSGVAADKVAGTTKAILNAVSFPRFVTELINGVFKAMNDSNQQQMQSYVELIKNVAASTDGFADANLGIAGAREWLADRFPAFQVSGDDNDTSKEELAQMSPEDRADWQKERDASTKLRLRDGQQMPTEGALRTVLGLGPQDSVPSGDPESLVPFARQALAKSKQQMLSTMVLLGLQRIVIDSGRISASMRFHIDTRSAAVDDRGSTFDERNEASADVGFKVGPWGVDAKMKNTIGYVSTQKTQTTEEMNTDLDLSSSVELIFRSDYVPLERLAGGGDVNRIRVNALNPDAEAKIASDERKSRLAEEGKAEAARSSELDKLLTPPSMSAPAPTPTPKPAETKPTEAKKPEAKKEEPKKTDAKTDPAKKEAPKPQPTQTAAKKTQPQPTPTATKTPTPTPTPTPAPKKSQGDPDDPTFSTPQ